jgi:dUTP pyrophosphatase
MDAKFYSKTVYIKRDSDAIEPTYATAGAVGADLCSAEEVSIMPGDRLLVHTGVYLEIPVGFEVQVRPRSGLALKHGITVVNSPGTIDSDYRGEVGVVLINHGKDVFKIKKGDRIAQLVLNEVHRMAFVEIQELSETQRGEGGYGSTGVSKQ